eukprot:jgi/Chlat1/4362/Chrsp29S04508
MPLPPPLLGPQAPPAQVWLGAAAVLGIGAVPVVVAVVPGTIRRFVRPQKCKTCLGVGHNVCVLCKGRGKTGGLFTPQPLEKCVACKGRGRRLCSRCAGTGIANRWLWRPAKDPGWGPRGW